MSRIAEKQGVSLQDLRKWNRLNHSIIKPGQRLVVYKTVTRKVPVKLVIDPEETIAEAQPDRDTTDGCETSIESSHVFHKPDPTDQNFKAGNDAVPTENVAAETEKTGIKGSNVVAKKTTDSITKARKNFIYHTVQPGDTLWNIAQRYQTNMDQIRKLNKIHNSRYLRSGSRIKIPVGNGG